MKMSVRVALDNVACGDAAACLMERLRLLHINEPVRRGRGRPRPTLFTQHNIPSGRGG